MVEVMSIMIVVAIAFVILAVGGGIAYWLWLQSRPKKLVWKAKVYQLGDGVIPAIKGRKGQVLFNYKLTDLRPFTMDTIQKVDRKTGATYYWLTRLKKAVPVVTADCVEVWNQANKEVKVLLDGDTCTILKGGYDVKTAMEIFRPLPHSRINMIKTEIAERNARIEETKDILQQIAPFMVAVIMGISLVSIAYFQGAAAIKISDNNILASEQTAAAVDIAMEKFLITQGYLNATEPEREIKEELPPEIPP